MADEYILKSYDGGAETTTLTSPFTVSGTTLVVANGSTFPDGSSGPFVVVVDRGLATEEKFLIDTTTGTNGTTFNIQQAGYDGTSASSHAVGATVEHCLDAYSLEQANRYVNLQSARGDLIAHNNITTTKLAVGANNTVLVADSAQSLGLKYSLVGENNIADDSITSAKLNSTLVQALQMPAGAITMYGAASAPTGYLLCDGTAVSRVTYAALFTAISTTYGPGNGTTTFNLPNLKGKVPVGLDSADATFDALGDTGGHKTHTLTSSEMPSHTHTQVAHSHGGGSHSHTASTSTEAAGSHTHRVTDGIVRPVLGSGTGALGYPPEVPVNLGTDTQSAGSHSHTASTSIGNSSITTDSQTPVINSTGGGTAHNNLQPYLTLNFIIKT
jgi:microcystin-dependent protein